MSLKHWLQHVTIENRRMADRRLLNGFAAAYSTGSEIKHGVIRDISATGIYVAVDDGLKPGTSVPLTLHRIGLSSALHSTDFVSIDARVVRSSKDGIAFAFEIPSHVDVQLWINLVDTATYESESDDIIAPFRLARALAFLTRICAPDGTRARQYLRANLTGQRLWNAVEIALKAESYLTTGPQRKDTLCALSLAQRVLDQGSWTEHEPMMLNWAGLLATACCSKEEAGTSQAMVELFSQLTPTHTRILGEACARGAKYFTPDGRVASRPVTASSDDILHFSDTRDFLRMGRALEHLSDLGLLQEHFKTSMFMPVDSINITPTPLGLQLVACCAGHLGPLEGFYGITPSIEVAAAS